VNELQRLRDMEDRVYNLGGSLADCWFTDQLHNLQAYYYIYFEPNNGSVSIATEPPGPSWQLASDQQISPAWSQSAAKQFITETLRRLPIFNLEGSDHNAGR